MYINTTSSPCNGLRVARTALGSLIASVLVLGQVRRENKTRSVPYLLDGKGRRGGGRGAIYGADDGAGEE